MDTNFAFEHSATGSQDGRLPQFTVKVPVTPQFPSGMATFTVRGDGKMQLEPSPRFENVVAQRPGFLMAPVVVPDTERGRDVTIKQGPGLPDLVVEEYDSEAGGYINPGDGEPVFIDHGEPRHEDEYQWMESDSASDDERLEPNNWGSFPTVQHYCLADFNDDLQTWVPLAVHRSTYSASEFVDVLFEVLEMDTITPVAMVILDQDIKLRRICKYVKQHGGGQYAIIAHGALLRKVLRPETSSGVLVDLALQSFDVVSDELGGLVASSVANWRSIVHSTVGCLVAAYVIRLLLQMLFGVWEKRARIARVMVSPIFLVWKVLYWPFRPWDLEQISISTPKQELLKAAAPSLPGAQLPEAVLPTSLIVPTEAWPKGQVVLGFYEDGDFRVTGNALIVKSSVAVSGFVLVALRHVLTSLSHEAALLVPGADGKWKHLRVGKLFLTGMSKINEVLVFRCDKNWPARLGLQVPDVAIARPGAVMITFHAGGDVPNVQKSYGSLVERAKTGGRLSHTASTVAGSSGAAVMQGGKVVAVHGGAYTWGTGESAGVANYGFGLPFLRTIRPESVVKNSFSSQEDDDSYLSENDLYVLDEDRRDYEMHPDDFLDRWEAKSRKHWIDIIDESDGRNDYLGGGMFEESTSGKASSPAGAGALGLLRQKLLAKLPSSSALQELSPPSSQKGAQDSPESATPLQSAAVTRPAKAITADSNSSSHADARPPKEVRVLTSVLEGKERKIARLEKQLQAAKSAAGTSVKQKKSKTASVSQSKPSQVSAGPTGGPPPKSSH